MAVSKHVITVIWSQYEVKTSLKESNMNTILMIIQACNIFSDNFDLIVDLSCILTTVLRINETNVEKQDWKSSVQDCEASLL